MDSKVLKTLGQGESYVPWSPKTPFDFVSKRPGEVFNVPVDLYAIWAITGKA